MKVLTFFIIKSFPKQIFLVCCPLSTSFSILSFSYILSMVNVHSNSHMSAQAFFRGIFVLYYFFCVCHFCQKIFLYMTGASRYESLSVRRTSKLCDEDFYFSFFFIIKAKHYVSFILFPFHIFIFRIYFE